jgi:ABC-type Fe3+/spermidine/putrescine transport system ATPase subunit
VTDVRVVNLTKRYGRIVALDRVSIDIHDGEYVAIIGPSGCGKTTFIKCLAGIVSPTEGEVYFDGKLMNGLPPEERGIGYVFQEIALFPHMDVWDNVTYGPRVRGWPRDRTRRTAMELLDLIKLTTREDAYPRELSGGARQKTGVARALASGSNLIFFDEPLGALDAKVRVELRYEIRNLVRDLGLTAIHITHDQEEALSIADRIVVMKAGRFVEVGTPYELYARPRTIFAANFVGEANFLEGTVVKASDKGSIVECGGGVVLESSETSRSEGENVVVAIRPEFVSMGKGHGGEGIYGHVETGDFEGSTARYEVTLLGHGLFAVRVPYVQGGPTFDVGDEVFLRVPPERVLVYPYPDEGLQRALDLEGRG